MIKRAEIQRFLPTFSMSAEMSCCVAGSKAIIVVQYLYFLHNFYTWLADIATTTISELSDGSEMFFLQIY